MAVYKTEYETGRIPKVKFHRKTFTSAKAAFTACKRLSKKTKGGYVTVSRGMIEIGSCRNGKRVF